MKRYKDEKGDIFDAWQHVDNQETLGLCKEADHLDSDKETGRHTPHIHSAKDGIVGVFPGDWIIMDSVGQYVVCKDKKFKETFSEV